MPGPFARINGAGALHLLSAVASFAIAAYAVMMVFDMGRGASFATWFLGVS